MSDDPGISFVGDDDPDIEFVGDDDLEESIFLVLDNDADKENIKVGEQVTWIISVMNKGAEAADNVQVLDQLPEGLKYVSHTTTKGTFDPSTGIWDIGNLARDEGKVSLYILTEALTPGEKINKANLTTDSVNENENNSYEEEEIDVVDDVENETSNETSNNTESSYSNVIPKAGNPLALILLSMFCIFTTYIAKSKK